MVANDSQFLSDYTLKVAIFKADNPIFCLRNEKWIITELSTALICLQGRRDDSLLLSAAKPVY